MIDPKKVRAQSQEKLYEQNEGRAAIKLKKYCQDLPPVSSMGKSALAGVLLYLMLFLLALLGNFDFFRTLFERAGILGTTLLVVITLAIVTIGYILLSNLVFQRQFQKVRSSLSRYRSQSIRIEKSGRESQEAGQLPAKEPKENEITG